MNILIFSVTHILILSFLVARCTKEFPYAFLWGDYCCRHAYENKFNDDCDNCSNWTRKECDGGAISKSSVCCQNDEYIACPDIKNCTNSDEIGKSFGLLTKLTV